VTKTILSVTAYPDDEVLDFGAAADKVEVDCLTEDVIPKPVGHLGAFENKRSFLSVENLIYIVEQFILQNPSSGIYHLADDEPISTNELIKLIAQSKGKKTRILHLNKTFIKNTTKMGDLIKFPVNSDRLQKLTENYVVSNGKMKQTIGIEKLPVNAKEGLLKTLKTFE